MNLYEHLNLLVVLASTFEKLERYHMRDQVLAEIRDTVQLLLQGDSDAHPTR